MYTYEITTGKWINDAGTVLGIGYSGKGPDKNNPASEGLRAEGPIPQGRYQIEGPPEDTHDHGPFVLVLAPDEATRQHILELGRDPDSFRLHGDSIPHPGGASEGCIIQSRDVREGVWAAIAAENWVEVVPQVAVPDSDGEIAV